MGKCATSVDINNSSSNIIMSLLKRRRDVVSWEYDSYCNDHILLYGSRPMSFSNYAFYRGEYLSRQQGIMDDVVKGIMLDHIIN